MRNLHPDTEARLATNHIRALLAKFDYTPSAIFLTNTPFDIDHGGDTYLGNGQLLGLGNLKQTMDIRVNTATVKFDAVDPSMVSILLNNNQHGRDVTIYVAILNDDYSIAGDPILMQSMIVDGTPKIIDDPKKGRATIEQKIASEFSNWSAKSGRATTPASQHRHFPNDTGLDFASESSKQYKWGAK